MDLPLSREKAVKTVRLSCNRRGSNSAEPCLGILIGSKPKL
jgi:hypothetical protein